LEGLFIQLYNSESGDWFGQYRSVADAKRHVESQSLDINDFEIRYEPSRYPKK
jgi:hypothetical protein